MKAEDLMIGDYVCVKVQVDDTGTEPVFETTPKRVTELTKGIYGIYAEGASEFAGAEIEPIPLTTEILEQNGFVPIRQNAGEPYYWQYFDKNDGSIVNAFRRIYRGLWIECSNATTEASTNKQCEFVHELQHAIKNTEIKMEVVVCVSK